MRYVIDIPQNLADEVNKQVNSGKYKSPQDFMLAAIQNQAYIESVEVEGDGLQSQHTIVAPSSPPGTSFVAKTAAARLLLPPETTHVDTVSLMDITRHDHLSGLTNRLFPVKPIVRVLSNLIVESGADYIELDELQDKSAEVARELGRLLQKKDRVMGRKRGTILSAGLPVGREDKSKSRFKFQFVGFIGKGKLEGAAPTLRFIDIVKSQDSLRAGLTEYGLKFCNLPNPIIDKQDYSNPFSDEEVDFLLDHLASQLPGEAKLMRLILKSVNDGIATPDQMTEKVESWRQSGYDHQWTENEVIAMRVGVISRMNELGLLDRQKDGVKVRYLLTDRGRNYLRRLSGMRI